MGWSSTAEHSLRICLCSRPSTVCNQWLTISRALRLWSTPPISWSIPMPTRPALIVARKAQICRQDCMRFGMMPTSLRPAFWRSYLTTRSEPSRILNVFFVDRMNLWCVSCHGGIVRRAFASTGGYHLAVQKLPRAACQRSALPFLHSAIRTPSTIGMRCYMPCIGVKVRYGNT